MLVDLTREELAALRSLAHTEAVNMRRAAERPLNRRNQRLQQEAATANELWAKLDILFCGKAA